MCLAALLLPCACASPGDERAQTGHVRGASANKVVLPLDTEHTPEELIAELYPGSTIRAQMPAQSGKKRFNLFTIAKKDGELAEVWFLLPDDAGGMKLDLKPRTKDSAP